jgi:hypothetical protein
VVAVGLGLGEPLELPVAAVGVELVAPSTEVMAS